MKSFRQYTDEIRRDNWPSGSPENLLEQHDRHFQEAFALVQTMVDGEQSNNVNVVPFCRTQYKCGMTILRAPRGIIRRVYLIANKDYCDPVFYRQVDWPGPECHGRQLLAYVGQATTTGRKLPLGFSDADAGNDSKCGRARVGIWALHQGNVYIAPWIQSVESVVIEWDGVKDEWGEDDPVPAEVGFRNAIKLYAQFAHERDYGDMSRALMFHNPERVAHWTSRAPAGHFDLALAELMWRDKDIRKTRPTGACYPDMTSVLPHAIMEESGIAPAAPGAVIVAHVGMLEGDNASVAEARVMAKLTNATAIFAAGFLRNTGAEYDDTVGFGFHDYVDPYAGSNGDGAETGANAFWPAPGKLDWDKDNLESLKAFFTNRTTDYYEVCLGDLHFFMLSSDVREPDGNTASGIQAEWLRVKLRLSTALWKIVVLADNPYSSVRQNEDLRWPFEEWGVDLVLSSGAVNYERLQVRKGEPLPFIVNGLACAGSVAVEPVTTVIGQSLANYSSGPAVLAITGDKTSLKAELILADGTVRDRVSIAAT